MINKQVDSKFNQDENIELLARTAWGEARGEGIDGMCAVMNVIMNRVDNGSWWGTTIEEVVKKPQQFSCWNQSDVNYQKMLDVTKADIDYFNALFIAQQILSEELSDITGGATHYHASYVTPYWADDLTQTAVIGNHIFYK